MEEYMKKLEGQDDSIDEEDIDDDINLNPLSKKNLSFNFSVFFIFGIWNLTIFLRLRKFKPVFKILFSYLIMRIFNNIFLDDIILIKLVNHKV